MTVDDKLDLLISKMSGMEEEITSVKQEVASVKQEVASVKQEVASVKQEVASVKQEFGQKVASIELTLENVTNVGIKIIGEGHADLNRKLDKAISLEHEKETMLLRLLSMENDVRKIKEHIKAS